MKIRADIAALLHQDLPDHAIVQQLHVSSRTVARTRAALRLPKAKPGTKAAATLEAAFRARTEPVAGGHLRWTGHWTKNNVPGLRYGGHFHTAHRVAFRIRTGRDAEGNARPECDYEGCVDPAHVQDAREREQARATYTAIFGKETNA
ncbi:hypothetical protein [Streptomyces sp. NPDC019937]|uniref:hypothetical protein n=1 Tax=Streptomyces sp. NPDC019937 TaxID=3154787 RepID=UPI0033D0D563